MGNGAALEAADAKLSLSQGGEKIIVSASSIRDDKVFTSDKKKIGTMVNVVFNTDPSWLLAELLVFPDGPGWIEKELASIALDKAVDVLKDLLPDEADKIAEDVMDKGTDAAVELWKKKLKEKEEKAQGSFYLVPTTQIAEFKRGKDQLIFKKDRIILKDTFESIQKNYGFADDRSLLKTQVAFYRAQLPSGNDEAQSLWPIDLNLNRMQGLYTRDPEGNKGRIENLQIDFKKAIPTNLVVLTLGDDAGLRLVTINDFDFKSNTVKKPFKSCEKCA